MRKREFTGKLPAIRFEPGKKRSTKKVFRADKRADRRNTHGLLNQARHDRTLFESTREGEDLQRLCRTHWKWRSENYRDISWWLEAHVGLPWNEVYSKLRALVDHRSHVGNRVLNDLLWQVDCSTTDVSHYSDYLVDEDGILCKWDPEVFEKTPRERIISRPKRPIDWPIRRRPSWNEEYDNYFLDQNDWCVITINGEPHWLQAVTFGTMLNRNEKEVAYPVTYQVIRELTQNEKDYFFSSHSGRTTVQALRKHRESTNWWRKRDNREPIPMIVINL